MGLSRYRMKDYARALEHFNMAREISPTLTNDTELILSMICCLKTENEDVAMQMMPRIEKRANYSDNIVRVWPYSLYFGILYHLGEETKAI